MAGIGNYEKGKAFSLKSGNKTSFKNMGSSPAKQGEIFDPNDPKQIEALKKIPKSVDPDAPGTPGKPGYEPPVKREDLDAKGKAIWDRLRLAKKNTPIQIEREKKKKSPAKQGVITPKKLTLEEEKQNISNRDKNKPGPWDHSGVITPEKSTPQEEKENFAPKRDRDPMYDRRGVPNPKKDGPNPKKDGKSPAKAHKPGHKKGTSVSDFDDTVAHTKKKEDLLDQGFTQEDADQMIKSGATTGKAGVESYKDRMNRLSKKYNKSPKEVNKILKSKDYKEGRNKTYSPLKQNQPKKSTESAHGQLDDAEREYQGDLKAEKRKFKLDHIGKPYMRPPYKDTASGTRPYEKRQGYHGYKDFDSIISQFQNKKKTKK